ncbi:MAG: flavodoxin reductase [Bacteroidetes bacterium]|nr:flavodoxin reductase [Bacteroidota bacterium]
MNNIVKIDSISFITHNVLRIKTEKPADFKFVPGQATEISINEEVWRNEKRPFTFTCLPEDNYLEFTIKTYPSRKGVTNELLKLKKDDELILHDVFGAIHYKGEGVFIAGGAGVTPFIAILRDLHSKNKIAGNKLIFSNKTKDDIILKEEFENLLGKNFINILSEEKSDEYPYGHISENFLKANISDYKKYFYLCGPPPMMEAVEKQLTGLKVERNLLIKEEF